MHCAADKSTPRVAASLSAGPLLVVQQAPFYKKRDLNATKGAGVHRLKGHLSWVQNGVSQFGLYLLEVLLSERRRDKYERNIPSAPLVYRLSDKLGKQKATMH